MQGGNDVEILVDTAWKLPDGVTCERCVLQVTYQLSYSLYLARLYQVQRCEVAELYRWTNRPRHASGNSHADPSVLMYGGHSIPLTRSTPFQIQ